MKRLFTGILVCFFVGNLAAQKVKYKDLYPLLSVQKYDQAEPFLKEFLTDDKNVEKYPNSLLQMAFIFDEKAKNDDVLLDTFQFQNHADSALYYYQQALKFIDDREVRKNDEYYQAYKRRDIRTGKFGIKLGDIQFDIENKIKALKGRKTKVTALALYYHKAKGAYDSANGLFVSLKKDYPSEKRLLLRLNDSTTTLLNTLKAKYNFGEKNFKNYIENLADVGNTGYNQQLEIKEIKNYNTDGTLLSDMRKDDVVFWNYELWANSVIETNKEEILPLFGNLIAFDQKLNDLDMKIADDSVSVVNEIPKIKTISSLATLQEYDKNPMPVVTFRYKIESLMYKSDKTQHANVMDSANVVYRARVLEEQVQQLKNLDSIMSKLSTIDIEEESKNYEPFVVSQYNSSGGLKKYLKEQATFIDNEARAKEEEFKEVQEQARWLVSENDSIPLFTVENLAETKYLPIALDSLVTAGMYFSGEKPAQGYMANVTLSRTQDVKVLFDLNSDYYSKSNYEAIKSEALVLISEQESIYFIMFYTPLIEEDGYTATVARANAEGLKWVNDIKLTNTPGQLAYNIQTDEIIINYDIQNLEGVGGAVVGAKVKLSPTDGKIVDP